MRVLILISGVFLLVNIVVFLLPTNIETSNLKYASDPEVNQADIRFLVEEQNSQNSEKTVGFSGLTEKHPDYTKGYKAGLSSRGENSVNYCFRIGPFLRETRIKSASKRLDDLYVKYDLIERQSTKVNASRVYVGPFVGASEAVAARKKLTEEGISDHFHRREGDGSYIVSLGIYSKNDSAKKQQNKFRAKNIAARVREEKTRLPKNYWIELSRLTKEEKLKSLAGIEWGESSVSAGMHACKVRT